MQWRTVQTQGARAILDRTEPDSEGGGQRPEPLFPFPLRYWVALFGAGLSFFTSCFGERPLRRARTLGHSTVFG